MKVSHFNTFPYGGAATAATRMHRRMLADGIDSEFCYHRNDKGVATDATFRHIEFAAPTYGILSGSVQRRLDKRRQKEVYRQFNTHLATREPGVETFSMAQLPNPTYLNWSQTNSDVVHLHWISFFADYPSFFKSIPNEVPIVWTLHDMNAFTGGCHYSNSCNNFRFGCGDCNQVIQSSPRDVSHHTFETKKKALSKKSIHVVTPSQWLGDLAKQSPIWPEQTTFQTIKLGFDLKAFSPIDKQSARKQLGIDNDSILIGFGAEQVNNRRKGIQHLLESLKMIQAAKSTDQQIECILFGAGKIEDQAGLPRLHEMGYVDSAKQQSLIYSAADIVVVPSREDNQPQVGLEAMACGTPVIGFNAGGIPEYVRDGVTGLLARLGDEQHLAKRINWLVENHEARSVMGQRARLMMEQEFDLGIQTAKYESLYQRISQTRQKAAA